MCVSQAITWCYVLPVFPDDVGIFGLFLETLNRNEPEVTFHHAAFQQYYIAPGSNLLDSQQRKIVMKIKSPAFTTTKSRNHIFFGC